MPVTVTDVTNKENNDPTLPAFTTDNGTNRYKPSIMDSPGRKKIIKGLGGEKQFKDMTGLLRSIVTLMIPAMSLLKKLTSIYSGRSGKSYGGRCAS